METKARIAKIVGYALSLLLVTTAAASVLGCGSSDGGSLSGTPGQGGGANNTAVLTGDAIGVCDNNTSLRRKKVSVTLDGGSGDFSLGDAYLLSNTRAAEYATFLVAVQNHRSALTCFVHITSNSYHWSDTQGGPSTTMLTSGPYVTGSVADVGARIYTNTCILPGGTGYLLDIQHDATVDLFASTDTVSFALEHSGDGEPTPAKLIPQGYTLPAGALTVTFKNVGTGPAQLAGNDLAPYFLTDDESLPTYIAFLRENPAGILPVNGQASAVDEGVVTAPGCAHTVHAFLSFKKPSGLALTASASGAPAIAEAAMARVAASRVLQGQLFAALAAKLGR